MKKNKIILWTVFLIASYFLIVKLIELKRIYVENKMRKERILAEIDRKFKPREEGFYKELERER